MNILIVGDLHFKTDNLINSEIFINQLEKIVSNNKLDFIVFLGDLLHTHEKIHIDPLNQIYKLIKKLINLTKIYILVGNHDYCNNQQFLTSNHWMNILKEWKNVIIVDKVIFLKQNKYKFIFIPYVYTGRFKRSFKSFIL